MQMSIAEALDAVDQATCVRCLAPYKRTDGKWENGRIVDRCESCGLDQSGSEAGEIRRRQQAKQGGAR